MFYCFAWLFEIIITNDYTSINMRNEIKIDSCLISYLTKTHKPIVLDEIKREIETSGETKSEKIQELLAIKLEMEKLEAALCIPLIFENKLIGIFNLGEKLSQDVYSDEDIDLLTTLSNQLAIAIENAALHEKMLEAQKQLLLADKLSALGRIAAGMAHEIKNPLAAIKGMTQAIERNPDDAETLQDFKDVVPKEVDRLSNLVENLAQLSRPPKAVLSQVNINAIIENCLLLFNNRCQNHHILVEKDLASLPLIKADGEQLSQVFTNLILNALQAMTDGGTLSIISRQLPEVGKIEVEIKDTGKGIHANQLKNIFEPFFTTKEDGMGLGLAITYKIIKDHGGEIAVRSQEIGVGSGEGKGTSFTVSLPVNI